MAKIIDIEGIGPVLSDKLAKVGITTTEKLLELGASKVGRKSLAANTDISENRLLEWVNRADLYRIKGVGEEFSDLLEAVGVDSPPELAQRRADNLLAAIIELNDEKHLVNRVPGLAAIEGYIAEAKKLDKIVTH